MLRKIDFSEFNHIYENIKLSFPSYKVRTLDEYESYFKEGKYQTFVFETDGKEVGFVMGYVFQNLKSGDYSRRFGFFHMDYLDIYEEYRNQGYGTKLMKELLNMPFTQKGIFYVLPFEQNYNDDPNDPYFERIGRDSSIMTKRFFDQFSQAEIVHYQNDKKFVYMYPGSDHELHAMSLCLIKGLVRIIEKILLFIMKI